ncbi:hypothetical protein [Stenotrophomonas sp. ASS1]|uniref:hypothetical protein n=1 Tax=Stenotrophomonas sp. ASS1 TaxID=2282124 RepID=UPI00104CE3A6|nr:hypothetical protein [Stenotrophomonas sp. ASS1]
MPLNPVDTTTDHGSYKGDPAKTAFGKLNDNDAYLDGRINGVATAAANADTKATNAAAVAAGKATKGSNGTWPDAIPTASSLWGSPARIQRWNSNSADRPVPFGLAICWSTMGHFNKVNDNWISQMGFGTDGEVYYTQSVNGNQFVAWRKFWSTGNTTVDANNFIKRA